MIQEIYFLYLCLWEKILETQKTISKVTQNYNIENKINAIGNKLFYSEPSQTAWKSYQSFSKYKLIDNIMLIKKMK